MTGIKQTHLAGSSFEANYRSNIGPGIRPGFFQGVLIALILSVGAVGLQMLGSTWLLATTMEHTLIAAVAFGYFLWLLRAGKSGRLAALVMWGLAAAMIGLLTRSSESFLLAHLALLSISRMMIMKPRLVGCLLDIVLVVTGYLAAAWAAITTQSLALTVWCFFLVQALIGLASGWFSGRPIGRTSVARSSADPFECSYHVAQTALRRLVENQR